MRGNFAGDFSRLTFDPKKRYSAVLMQQGRVQLDSDWNEQVEILAHRLRTQVVDFIGPTGAPSGSSGFDIEPVCALRFDGKKQYLTLGSEPSRLYAQLSSLRLEAVIKPRLGGTGGVVLCRFDRVEANQPLQFSYMLAVEQDGRLRFSRAGSDTPDLLSTAQVASGHWSRVTLDLHADRCELAINGESAGVLDQGATQTSDGAFFVVGQAQLKPDGPQGFEGSIREISLSLAEGNSEEPVGLWQFDRHVRDVVLDRSRNSNHAVLGGGQGDASPTLELDDLTISSGRYYVDGVLCESEGAVSVAGQPAVPGLALPTDRASDKSYLFYLDVWERYVSSAQDPELLEPALGGADTSGRTAIVAQVRWLPIEVENLPDAPDETVGEWARLRQRAAGSGRLRVQRPHGAAGTLENRLYRIEVHSTGSDARWKWSRDNGSIALPVAHLEEGSRTAILGAVGGGELALEVGDQVEIIDDHSVLADARYPLLKVESVDDATRSVTFSEEPVAGVGSSPELNPIAVRWDGSGRLGDGDWLRIEHGIDVRFDPAERYNVGDYWTFTTRTANGAIGWPQDEAGEPRAQLPQGVHHRLSALAVLRFHETGFELRDCRPVFQPLSTGMVSKAGDKMHGPLEIRPRHGGEENAPSLVVEGVAQADTLLGALGSPAAVGTYNLAPGAVSSSKIAPDVGTVPPGFAILGETGVAPPGYDPTGASLVVPNLDPQWESRVTVGIGEEAGELRSAAIGERVYTFSASGRVWEYDPSVGALIERRPMPEPRRRFAAGAINGKVYLIGGLDHQGNRIASTLEYDPAGDEWQSRRDMPTPRSDLALAPLDDKLYALGGLRDILFFEFVSRRNEVYDPLIDSWSRRRSLPDARYAMTAVGGPKGVFSFGGRRRWFFNWLGQALSSVNDEYLPGVDRWARRANPMPAPRSHGGAATIGDAIFVVGGQSLFGWTGDTSRYAPRGDGWEPTATLSAPIGSPGVAAVNGRLVLHAPGAAPNTLEVLECRIATTLHVHRKSAALTGDIEPQLDLTEEQVDELTKIDLERSPE